MQRSRPVIMAVAALLIGMEVLRAWWTVLPALGRGIGWIDIAAVAGLAGAAFGSASWLARRPNLAARLSHV